VRTGSGGGCNSTVEEVCNVNGRTQVEMCSQQPREDNEWEGGMQMVYSHSMNVEMCGLSKRNEYTVYGGNSQCGVVGSHRFSVW